MIMSPAIMADSIEMPWVDLGWPKELCIGWVQTPDPPRKGTILRRETEVFRELCKSGCTNRDAVWDAESGGCREPCIRWGAHWHHLSNTIELSACGSDAVLCQNTLTTCLVFRRLVGSVFNLFCWLHCAKCCLVFS